MKRTKHTSKMIRTVAPVKKKQRPSKYKLPGRRGVYDETVPKRVFDLAGEGLTERKIADAIGINHSTMDAWKNKFPELLDALLAGKYQFDHAVHKSLLQRAFGYTYYEVKTEKVFIKGKKQQRVTRTKKFMPPDVTAQKFWLTNRHPVDWSEVSRQEIHQVSDINVKNTLQLDTLTPEEQELVRSVALKKLASTSGVSRN